MKRLPETQIGLVVRRIRLERGLTIEELAAKSSIPAETLGKIERGKLQPTAPYVRALALGVGISADLLLGTETAPLLVKEEEERYENRVARIRRLMRRASKAERELKNALESLRKLIR